MIIHWLPKLKRKNACALLLLSACMNMQAQNSTSNNRYVNRFIGTGGEGRVIPAASVPFGMMQIAPDTRLDGSGYNYNDKSILGFSHVRKSGGGCADFLDILFMPLRLNQNTDTIQQLQSTQFRSPLEHQFEKSEPGYYAVSLYDQQLFVELTATQRCGIQRYRYPQSGIIAVVVDLKFGSQSACTIQPQHNVDTVFYSAIEKVNDYTIRGVRMSNGWAPEQQVYFYTTFSSPIKQCIIYVDNKRSDDKTSAKGRNIKAILVFDDQKNELEVKTAISAVGWDGAEKNLRAEVQNTGFDALLSQSKKEWGAFLSKIEIETSDAKKKELFYTSLHNVMMYPMLFSDVDYRFRGPDNQVHQTKKFPYYGMVVGLWDTHRAAVPLTSALFPNVMRDYVKTALEHYKYAGQLPIWTLWGKETYQMIGLHSLPMITNAYLNGIKDFDTKYALKAMVQSAMKDTCGFSMGYFVGMKNYRKYGYVPCNLEMEATARTLEYAFDDEAISKLAEAIGNKKIAKTFARHALNYKNVINAKTFFAMGRKSDGGWRTPFNPLQSEHRRDDYCEGNAWQWTFFVPHDVHGLAQHLGGTKVLSARLDSLFTMHSDLHGSNVSGDISGLIGQYAHGNEPGHHTIYMYNKVQQPHKTQQYVNQALTTLYNNTPDGICGNEDTGQMSAWYVFSALGFYPMNPVSGQYELGAPLFEKSVLHLPSNKKFTIRALNLSDKNIYVQKVLLNGKELKCSYVTYKELLEGGELVFEMKGM